MFGTSIQMVDHISLGMNICAYLNTIDKGSPAGVSDGGVQQGLYASMWHPSWGYGTIQCHMAATGYTWVGLKGTGLSNIRRVDTLPQSVNMLRLFGTLAISIMELPSIR